MDLLAVILRIPLIYILQYNGIESSLMNVVTVAVYSSETMAYLARHY